MAMTFSVLIFTVIGIVTPKHRGTLVSTLYFFFIVLSNVSGYYSARYYKMLQGTDWLLCAMLTSMGFPCFIFINIIIINLASWSETSSAAIPLP